MSEPTVKKTPTYRAFESNDIVAAHALSRAAGWPHRAEDWQWMFDAGSGFVAQDNGEVIGTAQRVQVLRTSRRSGPQHAIDCSIWRGTGRAEPGFFSAWPGCAGG